MAGVRQTSSGVVQSSDGIAQTALPTVVSRPDDDDSIGTSDAYGIRVTTETTWSSIECRISANGSNRSKAYIYEVGEFDPIGTADVSGLSAGDVFTIDLGTDMVSGSEYAVLIDNDGSPHSAGRYTSPSFPYMSDDGDLSIVNGASIGDDHSTEAEAYNIVEIGEIT